MRRWSSSVPLLTKLEPNGSKQVSVSSAPSWVAKRVRTREAEAVGGADQTRSATEAHTHIS